MRFRCDFPWRSSAPWIGSSRELGLEGVGSCIAGPTGEASAYLKVSFRPSDHPSLTALVIWSIHPAHFEMRRPYA